MKWQIKGRRESEKRLEVGKGRGKEGEREKKRE